MNRKQSSSLAHNLPVSTSFRYTLKTYINDALKTNKQENPSVAWKLSLHCWEKLSTTWK